MSRPRRRCPDHHNANPVEDVPVIRPPPINNKTVSPCWSWSCVPILLSALLLAYMYFAQQQQIEDIECNSKQTGKDLSEISREQQRLLDEINVRFSKLQKRLKGMEDREMNVDVGEVDYALGGKVLSVGSVENEKNLTTETGWLSCCNTISRPPQTILEPSHLPGDCWSVEIENAIATIQLTSEIHVKSIALEHLHFSKSNTGKTSSAPKFFSVWGVKRNKETDCLGSFEYDNRGPAVQTFPVKEHSESAYRVVRLQVFTNHGNPDYTCIYRIRVHGVPRSDGKSLQQTDQ